MSKYREVFDVLESTEIDAASEQLAALLANGPLKPASDAAARPAMPTRSFLEQVGLDGWATEDRHANGFYTFAG